MRVFSVSEVYAHRPWDVGSVHNNNPSLIADMRRLFTWPITAILIARDGLADYTDTHKTNKHAMNTHDVVPYQPSIESP